MARFRIRAGDIKDAADMVVQTHCVIIHIGCLLDLTRQQDIEAVDASARFTDLSVDMMQSHQCIFEQGLTISFERLILLLRVLAWFIGTCRKGVCIKQVEGPISGC